MPRTANTPVSQEQAQLCVLRKGVSSEKNEPPENTDEEAFPSKKKSLQISLLWKNYITVLLIYVIGNSYLTPS